MKKYSRGHCDRMFTKIKHANSISRYKQELARPNRNLDNFAITIDFTWRNKIETTKPVEPMIGLQKKSIMAPTSKQR